MGHAVLEWVPLDSPFQSPPQGKVDWAPHTAEAAPFGWGGQASEAQAPTLGCQEDLVQQGLWECGQRGEWEGEAGEAFVSVGLGLPRRWDLD